MWFNPLITFLLRTPLHFMVSKNMLLLTYVGKKTGKTYSTPVSYLRLNDAQGEYLMTTSFRQRTWWRSLRGGALVTVRLMGKNYPATAQAFEDIPTVMADLGAFLERTPRIVRYFNVRVDSDGKLNQEDLERVAGTRVIVQTRLQTGEALH